MLLAGAVLASLPVIVALLFIQRHIIEGLTASAVKWPLWALCGGCYRWVRRQREARERRVMNAALRTTWLPVALTLGTGMVDVASFARLGGVFSSVITGNLVLIGLSASARAAETVIHAVVAVAAYIVGVGLGTRIAGDTGQVWTRRVSHTLLAEMAILAAACGGWIAVSARPGNAAQLLIVSATAAAMGMQSAAVQAAGIPVSTTYLTGTVTGLVTGLVRRGAHQTPPRVALAALIALPCGAAVGGVLLRFEPRIVLVIPLALLGIVVALMERKGPTDGHQAGPGTSAG